MRASHFRFWFAVHKWTSLVATAFLLMLCITGLPLVFHDEIESLGQTSAAIDAPGAPSALAGLPLDAIVAQAQEQAGSGVPLFIGFSQDSPLITVTIGPAPDATGAQMRLFSFDRATGQPAGEIREEGVMHVLLQLHTDMFLGTPGMWLLGAMGALFLIAIISGLALYAPFMRNLPFATVRGVRAVQPDRAGPDRRARRIARLDLHNLLGVVTLGWALVVGLTGVINAFADPLTDNWREGELARMVARHGGDMPLSPALYGSIDRAMAAARTAQHGLSPQFIGFPGGQWSSARHYAIFFQGDTPLTAHILTPVLVDAATGEVADIARMPLSNQALMLSKPLHFGDYGGLPLKLVWAAMDLLTIWVLWSGLQLWLGRRRRSARCAPDAAPANTGKTPAKGQQR